MREINDNIAHDLRSPLARIRGLAEMTLTRDRARADFEQMAASTVEECDTLIHMVNTMLEITEAEAGVSEESHEEFDLVKLISGACEIFAPVSEQRHISVTLNLPKEMWVAGDRRKTQRIVMNLLENAIKFTPDRGRVAVSLLAQVGNISIVVEDTGVGISKEDLPHIFERFYRGEGSRSSEGLGLGLSLAKAFAVSLGGRITAESMLGNGSTFTFSFPAATTP
jgi:signal transduction histidine kinase